MPTATADRPRKRTFTYGDYVPGAVATRIIGRGRRVLERLAAAGHVRTHALPGQAPRYHRRDLEKFAPPA